MHGMCRVCLNESHSYFHIYENLLRGDHLYVVLNDVCQLDVKFGDGLPEFVCCDCYKKVSEFESFKRISHEGSAALQRMKYDIENVHLVPVKMEVEDSIPEEINHLEVYIKSEIDTGEDGFIAEETENDISGLTFEGNGTEEELERIPMQSEEESANGRGFVPVKMEVEVEDPLCLDEDDGARVTEQPVKESRPLAETGPSSIRVTAPLTAPLTRSELKLEHTMDRIRASSEVIQQLKLDRLRRTLELEREKFESEREELLFEIERQRLRREEEEILGQLRIEAEWEKAEHQRRMAELK